MSKSRNQFKRKIDATQVFQALLTLLQSRLPLKLANTRVTEADLGPSAPGLYRARPAPDQEEG